MPSGGSATYMHGFKEPGDGHFLTQQRLISKFRELIGLHPEKYAGYSFHIGVVTTAAAYGIR